MSPFDRIKRVRDQCAATGSERLILYCLATYANAEGHAWPSLETLSDGTGLGPRTLRENLAKLEASGRIRRDGKGLKGVTRWMVILPAESATRRVSQRTRRISPRTPADFAAQGGGFRHQRDQEGSTLKSPEKRPASSPAFREEGSGPPGAGQAREPQSPQASAALAPVEPDPETRSGDQSGASGSSSAEGVPLDFPTKPGPSRPGTPSASLPNDDCNAGGAPGPTQHHRAPAGTCNDVPQEGGAPAPSTTATASTTTATDEAIALVHKAHKALTTQNLRGVNGSNRTAITEALTAKKARVDIDGVRRRATPAELVTILKWAWRSGDRDHLPASQNGPVTLFSYKRGHRLQQNLDTALQWEADQLSPSTRTATAPKNGRKPNAMDAIRAAWDAEQNYRGDVIDA